MTINIIQATEGRIVSQRTNLLKPAETLDDHVVSLRLEEIYDAGENV